MNDKLHNEISLIDIDQATHESGKLSNLYYPTSNTTLTFGKTKIAFDTKTKQLLIENGKLENEAVLELCKVIAVHPNMLSLKLNKVVITDAQANTLAHAIRINKRLKALDFSPGVDPIIRAKLTSALNMSVIKTNDFFVEACIEITRLSTANAKNNKTQLDTQKTLCASLNFTKLKKLSRFISYHDMNGPTIIQFKTTKSNNNTTCFSLDEQFISNIFKWNWLAISLIRKNWKNQQNSENKNETTRMNADVLKPCYLAWLPEETVIIIGSFLSIQDIIPVLSKKTEEKFEATINGTLEIATLTMDSKSKAVKAEKKSHKDKKCVIM